MTTDMLKHFLGCFTVPCIKHLRVSNRNVKKKTNFETVMQGYYFSYALKEWKDCSSARKGSFLKPLYASFSHITIHQGPKHAPGSKTHLTLLHIFIQLRSRELQKNQSPDMNRRESSSIEAVACSTKGKDILLSHSRGLFGHGLGVDPQLTCRLDHWILPMHLGAFLQACLAAKVSSSVVRW